MQSKITPNHCASVDIAFVFADNIRPTRKETGCRKCKTVCVLRAHSFIHYAGLSWLVWLLACLLGSAVNPIEYVLFFSDDFLLPLLVNFYLFALDSSHKHWDGWIWNVLQKYDVSTKGYWLIFGVLAAADYYFSLENLGHLNETRILIE